MRNIVIVLLLSTVAGCAVDEVSSSEQPFMLGSSEIEGRPTTADAHAGDEAANPCDLLPAGEGACSVACDPDAIEAYIPDGTCVVFKCELTNGDIYTTGGCHLE